MLRLSVNVARYALELRQLVLPLPLPRHVKATPRNKATGPPCRADEADARFPGSSDPLSSRASGHHSGGVCDPVRDFGELRFFARARGAEPELRDSPTDGRRSRHTPGGVVSPRRKPELRRLLLFEARRICPPAEAVAAPSGSADGGRAGDVRRTD